MTEQGFFLTGQPETTTFKQAVKLADPSARAFVSVRNVRMRICGRAQVNAASRHNKRWDTSHIVKGPNQILSMSFITNNDMNSSHE